MTNRLKHTLLNATMMTPAERAKGRFMRAPDHDGGSGGGGKTFTQADIDAAVSKATGDLDGLKTKVEELIGENKKLKQQARAASEIKPEDLSAAEERADKAETALAEAHKQVKTLSGERDKAVKALEAEQGFTTKLLVENGLRDALAAENVTNPVHQKAAMAMLAGQVAVTADGETRVAKVGDKALPDFVKEWAGGDEGKHFVSAPANGGGGAQGGGGTGGGKTMPRAAFEQLDPTAKAAFMREGGKPVDATA